MKNPHIPRIHVATTPEERHADDENATRVFMDSCKTDTGWQCPWCKQPFTNPTAFVEHIVKAVNQMLEQTSYRWPPGTPPPGEV